MFKRGGGGEGAAAGTARTKVTGKNKGRKQMNKSILSIQHLAEDVQPATYVDRQGNISRSISLRHTPHALMDLSFVGGITDMR